MPNECGVAVASAAHFASWIVGRRRATARLRFSARIERAATAAQGGQSGTDLRHLQGRELRGARAKGWLV